jgi:hypothetical protein
MPKKTNIHRQTAKGAAKGQSAFGTDHDLPKPTTKGIIAAKLGCKPDELLAYVEKPNGQIIAIAPDGRKFKFIKEEV